MEISSLERVYRGKVRDVYRIDDDRLMMVATDRLSAFDVVLPTPIPGKGRILNQLSCFWFERYRDLIPNHLTGDRIDPWIDDCKEREWARGRSVIVKRLQPLPVEAIVRGYLIGSGWKDYQTTGAVSGIRLPQGLPQAAQLPNVIFTPSTKAAVGDHDENIDFEQMVDLIGSSLAGQVRERSIELYTQASAYAHDRGIIIADTKFEFGLDDDGQLVLMDEILTPDSSRFWPSDQYRTGISPPSYDKQFIRDYLETLDWDKRPPGPEIPEEIIEKTKDNYKSVQDRLTTPNFHNI